MRRTNALQCAFAAALSSPFCGTAHAEDWKVTGAFGWFAVGKTYQIEKRSPLFCWRVQWYVLQ